MFVPWEALNGRHLDMNMCAKGVESKNMRQVEEESQTITEIAFQA